MDPQDGDAGERVEPSGQPPLSAGRGNPRSRNPPSSPNPRTGAANLALGRRVPTNRSLRPQQQRKRSSSKRRGSSTRRSALSSAPAAAVRDRPSASLALVQVATTIREHTDSGSIRPLYKATARLAPSQKPPGLTARITFSPIANASGPSRAGTVNTASTPAAVSVNSRSWPPTIATSRHKWARHASESNPPNPDE